MATEGNIFIVSVLNAFYEYIMDNFLVQTIFEYGCWIIYVKISSFLEVIHNYLAHWHPEDDLWIGCVWIRFKLVSILPPCVGDAVILPSFCLAWIILKSKSNIVSYISI